MAEVNFISFELCFVSLWICTQEEWYWVLVMWSAVSWDVFGLETLILVNRSPGWLRTDFLPCKDEFSPKRCEKLVWSVAGDSKASSWLSPIEGDSVEGLELAPAGELPLRWSPWRAPRASLRWRPCDLTSLSSSLCKVTWNSLYLQFLCFNEISLVVSSPSPEWLPTSPPNLAFSKVLP